LQLVQRTLAGCKLGLQLFILGFQSLTLHLHNDRPILAQHQSTKGWNICSPYLKRVSERPHVGPFLSDFHGVTHRFEFLLPFIQLHPFIRQHHSVRYGIKASLNGPANADRCSVVATSALAPPAVIA
jgi:hypothetical protein